MYVDLSMFIVSVCLSENVGVHVPTCSDIHTHLHPLYILAECIALFPASKHKKCVCVRACVRVCVYNLCVVVRNFTDEHTV